MTHIPENGVQMAPVRTTRNAILAKAVKGMETEDVCRLAYACSWMVDSGSQDIFRVCDSELFWRLSPDQYAEYRVQAEKPSEHHTDD